jgi:biotin transport system substrate-specific component
MSSELSVSQLHRVIRLAIWGALIALGAWVAIPVGPVPITLQTYFIYLAGFMEGPRAFFAALLYLLAGILGLPVFAGGVSGPAIILGPTVGYALGFPVAALISGLGKGKTNYSFWRLLFFGLLAMLFTYLAGAIGLVFARSLNLTAAIGINLVFIPGDLIKLAAAVAVVSGLHYRKKHRAALKAWSSTTK